MSQNSVCIFKTPKKLTSRLLWSFICLFWSLSSQRRQVNNLVLFSFQSLALHHGWTALNDLPQADNCCGLTDGKLQVLRRDSSDFRHLKLVVKSAKFDCINQSPLMLVLKRVGLKNFIKTSLISDFNSDQICRLGVSKFTNGNKLQTWLTW